MVAGTDQHIMYLLLKLLLDPWVTGQQVGGEVQGGGGRLVPVHQKRRKQCKENSRSRRLGGGKVTPPG